MKKYLPYIAIVTAMLIWSVSGIAIKVALTVFPPLTMIVIRFSIAVVLMVTIGLSVRLVSDNNEQKKERMLVLQKVEKGDLPLFMLGGFFVPFLYYLLETVTFDSLSSPTIAEALLSMDPVFAPVFGVLLLREKVTRYNLYGIALSTVGMLMLLLMGADSFALGNAWGLLTAFFAVCAAVLYSVILRRIPTRYSALTVVCYMQGFALLLFIAIWLFTDKTVENVSLSGVLSVLYLAVFSSVTAFILFCYTVRQIGVTRANVFNNIRPAFTALAMFFLFDEHLPWGKLVGIVLIIFGLFICQHSTAAHSPKRE